VHHALRSKQASRGIVTPVLKRLSESQHNAHISGSTHLCQRLDSKVPLAALARTHHLHHLDNDNVIQRLLAHQGRHDF